jgi:hypothetical protein
MARNRVRTPRRAPEQPVPGQLDFFGAEPWQPSRCYCRPPALRGCGHCKTCDRCEDCGRCAGAGCRCECEDES